MMTFTTNNIALFFTFVTLSSLASSSLADMEPTHAMFTEATFTTVHRNAKKSSKKASNKVEPINNIVTHQPLVTAKSSKKASANAKSAKKSGPASPKTAKKSAAASPKNAKKSSAATIKSSKSSIRETAAPTTKKPTVSPTTSPTTTKPSRAPTDKPSNSPSEIRSNTPSVVPSGVPSSLPSSVPTSRPTSGPTSAPTERPTSGPTSGPTNAPTRRPTGTVSASPTDTVVVNSALPEPDAIPSPTKVSVVPLVGGLVVFFALLGGGIAAYEYNGGNRVVGEEISG